MPSLSSRGSHCDLTMTNPPSGGILPEQLPGLDQGHPLPAGGVLHARAADRDPVGLAARGAELPDPLAEGRERVVARGSRFDSQDGEGDGAARSRYENRTDVPLEEGGDQDPDQEKRDRHPQAERGRTASQLLESRSHAPPDHQARKAGQARREPGDEGAPRAGDGRVGQVLAGQDGHRGEERHDVDLALLDENREKQNPEDQPARRRRGPPALPERGRHEDDPGEGSPGEEREVEDRTARGAGEVVRRRPHELVQQVEPAPELEAEPTASWRRARGGRRPRRRAPRRSRGGVAGSAGSGPSAGQWRSRPSGAPGRSVP